MVPLISSSTVGPLGVCQMPRFWWKNALHNKGLIDPEYPNCTGGLDTWLLDFLNLSKEDVLAYLKTAFPSYAEFEEWVRSESSTVTDAEKRQAHNQRIWNRRFARSARYGKRKIDETFTDIGLDPLTVEYESAALLNSMQDWQLFYKRDVPSLADLPQLPGLIAFVDAGPLKIRYLPKIWLLWLIKDEGGLHPPTVSLILSELGIEVDEARDYVDEHRPDMLAFERWIFGRNGWFIPPSAIAFLNDWSVASAENPLLTLDWSGWERAHQVLSALPETRAQS